MTLKELARNWVREHEDFMKSDWYSEHHFFGADICTFCLDVGVPCDECKLAQWLQRTEEGACTRFLIDETRAERYSSYPNDECRNLAWAICEYLANGAK